MFNRNLLFATITATITIGCTNTNKINTNKIKAFKPTSGLKEVYKDDFLIGAAITVEQMEEKEKGSVTLIPTQFSAITPENIMKQEVIHPKWNTYDFSFADKIVAYGQKYNIAVNGHTLLWHSQMPLFAKKIQNADSFKTFFTNHINTVAARYDGKVKSWDVVNEALNEDGTMRTSPFFNMLGPNFVTEAFSLTQKAAPNTELYYNDYNIEQPAKRAGAITLIKKIQAAGVRIDGVGIQGHWQLGKIPLKEIEESINEFSALGIKVAFTELDIEVLPRNFTGADVNQTIAENPQLNPYKNGIPDSVQQQLAQDYENLFKLFLKYKQTVSRVTFWGVHDGQSWLNNWPMKGRVNYPLLFNRKFEPKPAYHKVIEAKTK